MSRGANTTVQRARRLNPRAVAFLPETVGPSGRRHRVGKRVGGTYALILFLSKSKSIRIGALGRFHFPRGFYIYVGSALNGLEARVGRHLGKSKKNFWHIDYFLEHARVVDVWSLQSKQRLECVWARQVLALENARVIAERFGASDCCCEAHLVQLWAEKRAKG